jgi:hypothetical protein
MRPGDRPLFGKGKPNSRHKPKVRFPPFMDVSRTSSQEAEGMTSDYSDTERQVPR